MPLTWKFRSTSGRDTFVCTAVQQIIGREGVAVCRVVLTSTFEDRARNAIAPNEQLEPKQEHRVELDQVLIDVSRLELLLSSLRLWLLDRTPVVIELSSRPGQRLAIQLGPDKRLISSTEKPGLFTTYSGIGLEFLSYTVVDQSCVSLAAEELHVVVRALAQTVGAEGTVVDLL